MSRDPFGRDICDRVIDEDLDLVLVESAMRNPLIFPFQILPGASCPGVPAAALCKLIEQRVTPSPPE